MLFATCGLKDGIRIADKKAAEYCYKKRKCEWLMLGSQKGGKGTNGQNGRPVIRFNGGSVRDAEDFFCEEEKGQQVRNFRGGKKILVLFLFAAMVGAKEEEKGVRMQNKNKLPWCIWLAPLTILAGGIGLVILRFTLKR